VGVFFLNTVYFRSCASDILKNLSTWCACGHGIMCSCSCFQCCL